MAVRRVSFRQASVAVEILSASSGLILPAKISGKSSADTESASLSAVQAQTCRIFIFRQAVLLRGVFNAFFSSGFDKGGTDVLFERTGCLRLFFVAATAEQENGGG